jgi:hypothetical protein
MSDLMDDALDAMERGDHAEGIRLAHEANRRTAALIMAREWRNVLAMEQDAAFIGPVPMRCRSCEAPATVAIRSGLEWHPTCTECSLWWGEHRHGPLSEVEPDYQYEGE